MIGISTEAKNQGIVIVIIVIVVIYYVTFIKGFWFCWTWFPVITGAVAVILALYNAQLMTIPLMHCNAATELADGFLGMTQGKHVRHDHLIHVEFVLESFKTML